MSSFLASSFQCVTIRAMAMISFSISIFAISDARWTTLISRFNIFITMFTKFFFFFSLFLTPSEQTHKFGQFCIFIFFFFLFIHLRWNDLQFAQAAVCVRIRPFFFIFIFLFRLSSKNGTHLNNSNYVGPKINAICVMIWNETGK